MRICDNGVYRDMTAEEIANMEAQADEADRQYWLSVSYNTAVNSEIRKKYEASDEFAILRQKDEKPEEYEAYYAYCEECKAYVKQKMEAVNR